MKDCEQINGKNIKKTAGGLKEACIGCHLQSLWFHVEYVKFNADS